MTKDILVIGTGISGLTFAIKVAEENPKTTLTLISKSDIKEGNTRYAQGGIAVVRNLKKDSTEKHFQDTLIAGDGSCDPKVVMFSRAGITRDLITFASPETFSDKIGFFL